MDQKRYAATAWDYAVSLCLRSLPDGPERDALLAVEEGPTIANVRAVLAIARCKPWQPLIESALSEIGIAAIEDILKD